MTIVTRYPTINGKPCMLPTEAMEFCQEHGLPAGDLDKCNSLHVPVGMEAGHGFFVTLPTVEIPTNSWMDVAWVHEDPADATKPKTTTWKKYCLLRRYSIGADNSGNAPTVCEIADKRHVLKMSFVTKDYNIRRNFPYAQSPVATASFYSASLNGSSRWTWQQVLQDLWNALPSVAGTCPTLAWSPTEPPENYNVHGSAWDAIGKLLDQCQSVLVLDPVTDTFTIARIGEEQSGLTSAISNVKKLYIANPKADCNLATIPEKIVYVAKKQRLTNGASTSAASGGSLLVDPFYTVEKTTGLTGALAGTKTEYFIDQYALVADDDSVSNTSALSTIIDELHAKVVLKLDRGTERQLLFVGGVQSTLPLGSQVHSLLYRDYGDAGLVTEVRFTPSLVAVSRPVPHEEIMPYPRVFAGKADSAISKGSTGTVSIWRWNGSAMADTTKNVTALAYGAAITSGKIVSVWEEDGLGWLVAPWECA